jgi:outer membrane biosynthesis protein TonB
MIYNAHDIERYLNRQMNAAEMHTFEEAMMDDPMLADAVDGYQSIVGKRSVETDLSVIKERLSPKKENGKLITGFFRPWMRMAAAVVIIGSAAAGLYFLLNQPSPVETTAVIEKQQIDTVVTNETVVDSTAVAIQEIKPATEIPVISPFTKQKQPLPASPVEPATVNNDVAVADMEPAKNTEVASAPPPAVVAAEKKEEATAKGRMETNAKTKASLLNKFTGVVVDENNNPLPFANITEVTSGVGTYADAKGNFVLVAQDSVLNIETRSVGYSNATLAIRKNQPQRIALKDEAVIANAPTRDQLYLRNRNRPSAMQHEITELESEPADGWNNYSKYVMNNLRLDNINEIRRFGDIQTEKEVEVSFDVNPDGSIANFKVERSTCETCNQEAIRLIKEGPKWKSKTGKKERARFTVQF